MSQITIKNISSATVVISVPEINFNRSLVPGRSIPITQEIYDNLLFEPGVQNMIRGGYITVSGVEEGSEVEVKKESIKDTMSIETMMLERDITSFAKYIPNASPAAKETIIQCAVEHNITDAAFTALIKKYCGVDVINAISMKHQAEEK
jgi:hypothetical protein